MKRSGFLNARVILLCALPLLLSILASKSAADSNNAFIKLLNSISTSRSGDSIKTDSGADETGSGDGGSSGSATLSARDYYILDVDSTVQNKCKGCHQAGGSAINSGARLVFTNSPEDNHLSLLEFITDGGGSADLVLSKMTGGSGHGGGQVISPGSIKYQAFEQYFALLSGEDSTNSNSGRDFWQNLAKEDRDITLRRASILLAGKVADNDSTERAIVSDQALKGELIKLMRGDGFHEFLISGADDRLLTDGLVNGVDFAIKTEDRFPAHTDWLNDFPIQAPDEPYNGKPFFTRMTADQSFRWAIHREPLELIAHIVMTDQSYKKILTADYTMVNPVSNIGYRSGVEFEVNYLDENGYADLSKLETFKPGRNRGHIPWDADFRFDYENRTFESHPDFHEWPHSGVLSTLAWLARYPSTDTNRNRARARWTYYHFLGIDIEKSAPRTTDPIALADTNNPTMNNSACTVCHERLDPLAGAYQLMGARGHYYDQFWGLDSLSDSYKYPEKYGGQQGSTLYVDGDTWYRDMRRPGFEGKSPPTEQDSLQWLAKEIANDSRFAPATVKFWWPAVFGTEVLIQPEDPEGADYEQRLRAYNAQESLVAQLAEKFIASEYRLKALLADMVLSPWYRVTGASELTELQSRAVELATVGRGRLLTPEELDRKNIAVFGRSWGQVGESARHPHFYGTTTKLSSDHPSSYKTFYGGTDSAGLTIRNRKLTPLMSNVSEAMALELACQAVAYDLFLPMDQRKVFTQVEKNTRPGDLREFSVSFDGTVDEWEDWQQQETASFDVSLPGGAATVFFVNDNALYSYFKTDDQPTKAEVIIQAVAIEQNNELILRVDGVNFPSADGFDAETAYDSAGNPYFRGNVDENAGGWWMHGGSWVSLGLNLPAGDYVIRITAATSLQSNNVNDEVNLTTFISTVDGKTSSRSALAIRNQLSSLLFRASNKKPSEIELDFFSNELDKYAARVLIEQGPRWNQRLQDGSCNTSMIWSDSDVFSRYSDPRGMIRAWIMISYYVLTSYSYLHD